MAACAASAPVLAQDQVPAAAPPGPPAAEGDTAEAAAGTATVVVTARKFSERLVDVPIAIAVFSNDDLTRRGASNIADVLQTVPGVTATGRGSGQSAITIRGISTTLGGNANGYYLDDLPFTGVTVPLAPHVQAWDLERVEVLRGPQGTLFGEGSMGGTIRSLTNNARLNMFSFAGQSGLSHTEGGGSNRTINAMLNVPLVEDTLAVRVALTDGHAAGWIDDPAHGRSDINASDTRAARVRVLFRPTDALTINGTYWRYRSDYGAMERETDAGTAAQGNTSVSGSNYTLKGLSGTYEFDAFSLFYGYADNQFSLPEAGTTGGGPYTGAINIGVKTHELRLSSASSKPWRWTGGLYRRTAQRNDRYVAAAFEIDNINVTTTRASALFGELTYTFPDFPLEASLGARHFRDTMTVSDINLGVASPDTRDKFISNNPRLNLAYRPTANQQIYASASKGFRSGQSQATAVSELAAQYQVALPATLKPDSIWTYELGTKIAMPERRLNMEFAVYHSDWKDFAVRIPIGNTGMNGLIGSPGARTNGLDASFNYAVSRNFTATLTAGVIDARYSGAVPGTLIRRGSRVDDVPIVSASLGAEYRFAAGAGWNGLALAGVQHSGRHLASTSPRIQSGDPVDNINARLAFSKGPWTVSLFGENLADDHGATSFRITNRLSATTSETVAQRLRPRTVGLELRYAMGK